MPEKVATAMDKLNEDLLGAEYTPIAYLGSQPVNGTNHAVLAEQLIITGKDVKNVVLVVFNEKPGDINLTLVNIEGVVAGGPDCGGVEVDVKTDIPAGAKLVYDEVFAVYTGANINPFALLATQVVRGVNYIFAAELDYVTQEPSTKKVVTITINDADKTVSFADVLN